MIDVPRALVLIALVSGCVLDRVGTAAPRDAEAQTFDAAFDSGGRDAFVPPDVRERDGGSDAGSLPDAGPESFYDLDWGDPVALGSTVDGNRCETDPVVTTDLRWLYVSRPNDEFADCYSDRRFHVFRYDDGDPIYVSILARFDALTEENNPHPLSGAVIGSPDRVLFFYQSTFASFIDIRMVELAGEPPIGVSSGPNTIVSGALGPTLTADGTRMIFSAGGRFIETTGTPPATWTGGADLDSVSRADDEGDAALSADGRVLVYFARWGGEEPDLWVARRREVTMPFDDPVRLPAPINSPSAEMDSFLTSSGDLLYVSARGDGTRRRIYLARRVR